MSSRVRPVAEQTIVLTGESSGIGRARATLVLVARDLEELNPLAEECRTQSGRALCPVLRLTSPMLAVHGESSEAPVQ
jgi:NADP-dependent 3-hydroxy acid dehydrogenase YdfG